MQIDHSAILSRIIIMSEVSIAMLYSSKIKSLYRGEDATDAKDILKLLDKKAK